MGQVAKTVVLVSCCDAARVFDLGQVTLGVMVKLGNAIEWVGVLYQAIEWVIGLVVCIAEWVDGEYRVAVEIIGLLAGLVARAYAFEQAPQFVVNPGVLLGQAAVDIFETLGSAVAHSIEAVFDFSPRLLVMAVRRRASSQV